MLAFRAHRQFESGAALAQCSPPLLVFVSIHISSAHYRQLYVRGCQLLHSLPHHPVFHFPLALSLLHVRPVIWHHAGVAATAILFPCFDFRQIAATYL